MYSRRAPPPFGPPCVRVVLTVFASRIKIKIKKEAGQWRTIVFGADKDLEGCCCTWGPGRNRIGSATFDRSCRDTSKTDLRQRRRCCPRLGSADDLRPPHSRKGRGGRKKKEKNPQEREKGNLPLNRRGGGVVCSLPPDPTSDKAQAGDRCAPASGKEPPRGPHLGLIWHLDARLTRSQHGDGGVQDKCLLCRWPTVWLTVRRLQPPPRCSSAARRLGPTKIRRTPRQRGIRTSLPYTARRARQRSKPILRAVAGRPGGGGGRARFFPPRLVWGGDRRAAVAQSLAGGRAFESVQGKCPIAEAGFFRLLRVGAGGCERRGGPCRP
ncbi:hypothetical protein LY76DRAFT_353758 [Colletotrichum caudatum]|nr:hypothetical protein LY76DRAFT_353758 [Colletotrichum caudatum]